MSQYTADVITVISKLSFLLIIMSSQCEGRINAEREIKRFVRPFGKVINEVTAAIDKAVFDLKNIIILLKQIVLLN